MTTVNPVIAPPVIAPAHGFMAGQLLAPTIREVAGEIFDAQAERLDTLIRNTKAEIGKIESDPGLSKIGKADRIAELKRKVGKQLDAEEANPKLQQDIERSPSRIAHDHPGPLP